MTDASDATPDESAAPEHRGPIGRVGAIVVGALIVVTLVAVSFAFGRISTLGQADPTTVSAEAGFARDMQVHHLQGVDLALIIRETSDDPDIDRLAYDMATVQAQQAGQMYGWLEEWELPQAGSEPQMTWMTRPALAGAEGEHADHDASTHAPGDPMPGLATFDQVEALRAAEGVEAERIFFTLMIRHHEGALEMSEALLARSTHPIVTSLARAILESQAGEIALMTDLLDERGGPVEV
ncbi:DUF305 domain-containing protein [Agromyces rhizosphaerae]|uniref:DUF305 domain-containing protein n=1 Tax=Agromyces rhizosphaerae TaxID=88374 RepID=A0A9W6CVY4_9MICO|nr:DUF305 domain-containing protein [Agromyces rhizosphaerae]GLI26690.1 DUF305 domain-containing protein [Agromyces rhizosphaerae]